MKIFTLTLILTIIAICRAYPIRGIWFTVSGTKAPYSKQGIYQVVLKAKQVGINTIYFSVWDESMVNFKPHKSFSQKYPFVKMNPQFEFDPLEFLIEIAHGVGMKVLAWFEFGFATTYNDPQGGYILKLKPEWKGIDQKGNLAQKNKFQWMNGFLPEVQTFMIDLVSSICQSHKVDGIQGDDRLPAMPSLAGYDKYTVSLYKSKHAGKEPPQDYKQEQWVNWRAGLLNQFMAQLSKIIRQKNKGMLIHMSPSVYPWCKYQYLQDWPTWVSQNLTDVIIPQIYRYSLQAYADTLQQNLGALSKQKQSLLYPGMLVGLGSNTTVNAKILADSLAVNRKLGVSGEVFFYHESLSDPRVAEIIADYYRVVGDQ